jgi:hypothetical protein
MESGQLTVKYLLTMTFYRILGPCIVWFGQSLGNVVEKGGGGC